MNKYCRYTVTKTILVRSLVTVESLDVSDSFSYPEEIHDFYEFAYLDSGQIRCVYDGMPIVLTQGDFLLIPPDTRHFYEADGGRTASFFVLCFAAKGDVLSILDSKIPLDAALKRMVSDLLREAKNAFVFPFRKKLQPRDDAIFGSQQMVENDLEKLLIHLVRREMREREHVPFVMNSVDLENRLVSDLIALLKEQLYDRITLDEICRRTHYSKTFLNTVFKKNTGYPIMRYYGLLRIGEAKRLIRENISIAAAAARLNYESPTYFTKVFKKYTGMTPTEFRKTVL